MRNPLRNMFSIKGFLFRTPFDEYMDKVIVNTAVMITLFSFLFMISGCSYYRSVTRVNDSPGDLLTKTVNDLYRDNSYPRDKYPMDNLYQIFILQHHLYLVDSTGQWDLSEVEIKNDTVYAAAKLMLVPKDSVTDLPGDKTSVKYKLKKEADLLKRVFIYTNKGDSFQGEKVSFSVYDISKVITFKDHPAAKVGFVFLIVGGA
jgi:hypothetical protein